MRSKFLIKSFVVLLFLPASARAIALRTVALTGQLAPGTSSGVTYEEFGSFQKPQDVFIYHGPVLNDAGQVAFRANVTGSDVNLSNNQGVWSEGSGSLTIVARTGGQAPGASAGVSFSTIADLELMSPVLNNAGQTAFYAGLSDGGLGLWSEGSGSLALVARSGESAPGTPTGVSFAFDNLYDYLDDVVFNDAGQTAFRANLIGNGVTSATRFGIWSEGTGSLKLLARLGEQAPGLAPGAKYGDMFEAGLNNAGQTVFFSFLSGSGVNSGNDRILWSDSTGSLAQVARKGSPDPVGETFGELFNTLSINDAGRVAFHSAPPGTNVPDYVWSDVSGSLAMVARRGNHAPGLPDGVNFDLFPGYLAINNSGQVMVPAVVTGTGVDSTNSNGIWLADSGILTLIVRRGDHAPGTSAGVNFDRFGLNSWPSLNDAGQVAFRSTLTGSGIDATNDRGIWATDHAGSLQLLIRTGELIEVAPGDFRTVSALEFVGATGNSDGRASGFNNFGQLAYWARFTDGSEGVFVSNEVAFVAGDYNQNGVVDAADYTVWRDNLGGSALVNRGLGITGPVGVADYDVWKSHFGESIGAGSGSVGASPSHAAAPEPTPLALAAVGLLGSVSLFRRRPAGPGQMQPNGGWPFLGLYISTNA